MSTRLHAVRSAGAPIVIFITSSEAARALSRPLPQITKAMQALSIPIRRGGCAANAPFLLTETELAQLKAHFQQ